MKLLLLPNAISMSRHFLNRWYLFYFHVQLLEGPNCTPLHFNTCPAPHQQVTTFKR